MALNAGDLPHPALDRLIGGERKLWHAALERQYRSPKSSYRRNLPWYGDVGATYLGVATLWLVPCYPLIVLVVVSQLVENGPLLLVALLGALACLSATAARTYLAVRVGRTWRQDNGVGRPPKWKSRTGYQPPEGGETRPPIGWAQTSKIPPGWKDPDTEPG